MTRDEVMQVLAAKASATTKKTLMLHGAPEPIFGVRIGDMKSIQKQIKGDQALAMQLYATCNSDGMYLAGMVADGRKMTRAQIGHWAKQASWQMIAGTTVPWVAAEHPDAIDIALEWIDSPKENIAIAGWATLSNVVTTTPDEKLPVKQLDALLTRIVKTIKVSPNRVRYVMNNFIISCGTYVAPLGDKAIAAARKIGRVEVNMGQTECQVPEAENYILKSRRGAPSAQPTAADLADPSIAVVDVGGEHTPERHNFDHHQFPADHPPVCALSLVLQHLGVYEDARQFCDWLEPAEWFDTRGPNVTARWLGVDRSTMGKLSSPIDITVLRRFAKAKRLQPCEPLWEILSYIGQDLLDYLRDLRSHIDFVAQNAEIWSIDNHEVLFLPRTNPIPDDPSAGIVRYLESIGKSRTIAALIYPDRRGSGYGLSRHNDDPRYDFTRIEIEADVHFAHARGFVAKTSADDIARVKQLLGLARV